MKSCESTVAFADGQFISNFARSRAVCVAAGCLWSSICCCVAQPLALTKSNRPLVSTPRTRNAPFTVVNIIFLLNSSPSSSQTTLLVHSYRESIGTQGQRQSFKLGMQVHIDPCTIFHP